MAKAKKGAKKKVAPKSKKKTVKKKAVKKLNPLQACSPTINESEVNE